eukprot:SAG31_NODE_44769_length_261_cov_0.950617_2_plen_25_part_01
MTGHDRAIECLSEVRANEVLHSTGA